MSQYIAEKYGGLVNAEGVIELFTKLEKHLGDNRSKAAEECSLTRKSIYDWQNLKGEIKLDTKIKVLETLIEQLPTETLGYLTNLMHDNGSEALMGYLSTIYEKACDTTTEYEFKESVNEFENAIKKFAGLAYKKLDYEITDMISSLAAHARSQNINWTPKQFMLYDSETIKQIIPQIISSWIYRGMPQSLDDLAQRNKIPIEIVHAVDKSLQLFYPQFTSNYDVDGPEFGFYVYGNNNLMLGEPLVSTAGAIVQSSRLPRRESESQ